MGLLFSDSIDYTKFYFFVGFIFGLQCVYFITYYFLEFFMDWQRSTYFLYNITNTFQLLYHLLGAPKYTGWANCTSIWQCVFNCVLRLVKLVLVLKAFSCLSGTSSIHFISRNCLGVLRGPAWHCMGSLARYRILGTKLFLWYHLQILCSSLKWCLWTLFNGVG